MSALCSVFDGMSIPYPKRKVITEDEPSKDEKQDHKVSIVPVCQRPQHDFVLPLTNNLA